MEAWLMRARIEQELGLLREQYPDIEHAELDGEDWLCLPRYSVPPGWRFDESPTDETCIVFQVKADYPGNRPYGFLVPSNLNYGGASPTNAGDPPKRPPFDGAWRHYSWDVENWSAKADAQKGSNLLAWCRSFRQRFLEGA